MGDVCKICGNAEQNQRHVAREMMFGLRDKFAYLECAKCGCVQLLQPPADMAKYYPPHYYSLRRSGRLKTFLGHQWAAYAYWGRNPIGWVISKNFFPHRPIAAIRRANISRSARILDVGGGTGQLLRDLRYLGFQNLTGADPYIEQDITYPDGTRVFKKSIGELTGTFDVAMLHHSFEHMDNPEQVMQHAARLLAPGGLVLLRIPIAGSLAWRKYGTNWIHLDAPRHLFLHTPTTIDLLAKKAGLRVDAVIYEGDESQFWGSEQYARDIPLRDPRSYARKRRGGLFTAKQIREFAAQADKINLDEQGDLACFHLRK